MSQTQHDVMFLLGSYEKTFQPLICHPCRTLRHAGKITADPSHPGHALLAGGFGPLEPQPHTINFFTSAGLINRTLTPPSSGL